MTNPIGDRLIDTIKSSDARIRDLSIRQILEGHSIAEILESIDDLERFRQGAANLYERVRASMFLHALFRYEIQESAGIRETGLIPVDGFKDLMERRFERAIATFHASMKSEGPNGAVASALAQAYEQITYKTLADQVRMSVRNCAGNRWMFRVGGASEHPIRLNSALFERSSEDSLFPILIERTPVRLDLSHSAWSDIFFLGMDFPEGAKVINISVDLGVHGRDDRARPPIETRVRVIPEPLLRLTSIDLNACKDVTTLEELFNFGNDYLSLIKAGVIASGLIPPSLEGTSTRLEDLLARVVRPGYGLEVVCKVNDIPKGSRLAVSTNLLASLISLLMRATGQTKNLTGPLLEAEARVVVARAILGEWIGGSGGGWQDSGGIFPGVKIIHGVPSAEGDPESGISRGRLLPAHQLLNDAAAGGIAFQEALARSLVLVHGGMAQNVGPILNMVTGKYLLRSHSEWVARGDALAIFDEIVNAVTTSDVKGLGGLTTRNWDGPLKSIIPWVSNQFTEAIIAEAKSTLGEDFWGFLMLGGMSGGGMAFFVAPHRQEAFRGEIKSIMERVKTSLDDALPFAMTPVVYDFQINPRGSFAELQTGSNAMMPSQYYSLQVPRMIAEGSRAVNSQRKSDIDHFANHCSESSELLRVFRTMINNLFPVTRSAADNASAGWDSASEIIRRENGFDPIQHAQYREDLQRGRIGLARNRLPVDTDIRDVVDTDLIRARGPFTTDQIKRGTESLQRGEVGVVSLAAGVGSRWTTGAGVVKALNPFVNLEGKHRSFLEVHLAKTKKARPDGAPAIPHVVTTSYLTHSAIDRHLVRTSNYGYDGPVFLSRGQSIGQRLIPMTRDLTFLWEEGAHETLDENKQKVRESSRRASLDWARAKGEGADYVDNVPLQRFNPPGHFHEVPNLLRNGVLEALLGVNPNLRWLMVHNIDTLGVNVDPGILGMVLEMGTTVGFEVIPKRVEDRGGGLARVGGRVRILEGLAQPREDTEFRLSYYNSNTSWVDIDRFLDFFKLSRTDVLHDPVKVGAAVRAVAVRLPTYVTIKDVKRRWGQGQEDVFPVVQFEKLWGDITSLPDLSCSFLAVDRKRGQQLKDTAQLDGWANDGSRDHVLSLCEFAR